MSVPTCGSGCARAEASSEAEVNPRTRRSPLEGAVNPRARRNLLEGGANPRARRNPLEGAFEWAALVVRGDPAVWAVPRMCALSGMCLVLVFCRF
jgi:hypothetical protein